MTCNCECKIQIYAVKEFKHSDIMYQRLVGLYKCRTDAKVYTHHMNSLHANEDTFFDYKEWSVN
jgi:hypothetical protein